MHFFQVDSSEETKPLRGRGAVWAVVCRVVGERRQTVLLIHVRFHLQKCFRGDKLWGSKGTNSGAWPGLEGAKPGKASFPDNRAADWISRGKPCAMTHRPDS